MDKPKELSFAALDDLNKNEYFKLFKKPMPWKKATGVLFLAKHKFSNGKVDLVAVPFKKYPEAAKCFKTEVKPSSTFTARLTALCQLQQQQDEQGQLHFHFTLDKGGMNLDFLQAAAKELFGRLSIGCSVEGAADAVEGEDVQEIAAGEGETLTKEQAKEQAAGLQARAAKADKIAQNLSQFEKAIGKVEGSQLQEKLRLYEQTLTQLAAQATPEEQTQLEALQTQVADTQGKITDVDEAKAITATIRSILQQL